MNDFIKALSYYDPNSPKTLYPLTDKIPLINYSMLHHIFSPLVTNSESFDNIKQLMLSKSQFDELTKRLEAIKRGVYFKASGVFLIWSVFTNSFLLNPIQTHLISSANGFRMFKYLKIIAIPLSSYFLTYEFVQGIGIDLNSYFPQCHPYYNLIYFDAYYKRDLLGLSNIDSLDSQKFNELSDYSTSRNKNKKEIENVLNFFVIKQHYLLLLLSKKILQSKGNPPRPKPFNENIYDPKNWVECAIKPRQMDFTRYLTEKEAESSKEMPKIWIETDNIKETIEMGDLLTLIDSHMKLKLMFRFAREYRNIKKENRLIDENRIKKEVEVELESRINQIGRLVEHDIYTSNLYRKYKIFNS